MANFSLKKKNNSPIKTTQKIFKKEIIKEKAHDVILEDTHHKEGMVKNDIKEETVFKRKVRSSSFSLTEIMEDKKKKFNTTNFSEKNLNPSLNKRCKIFGEIILKIRVKLVKQIYLLH